MVDEESRSVLVIGAQGALGRLCADGLREAGFDVIRAGRRPEDAADFRLLDLDQPDSVADACAGVDFGNQHRAPRWACR